MVGSEINAIGGPVVELRNGEYIGLGGLEVFYSHLNAGLEKADLKVVA